MAKKSTTTAIQTIDTKIGEKFLAKLRHQVQAFEIKNDADFEKAWTVVVECDQFLKGEFITGVKHQKQRLHTSYKFALKQLNDFVDPTQEIKDLMLAKRMNYTEKRERAAALLTEKRLEEAKEQQIEDAKEVAADLRRKGEREQANAVMAYAKTTAPALAPAAPVVPKAAGSVVTEVFDFTIDNPELVPDEYWRIDDSLIRSVVNTMGLDAKIPGVSVTRQRKEHSRGIEAA